MNKSLVLVLFLFGFTSKTQNSALTGDTWADVSQRKKGTVVFTYVNTPGFSYKDSDGKPAGVCVDIMNDFVEYVRKTKGVKLEAKFQGETEEFKIFYQNIKKAKGGVIGLGNITITEARKKEVKFTPPFCSNVTFLLTHNNVPTLSKLSSLGKEFKGMTAYTIKNTTNEAQILEIRKSIILTLKFSMSIPVPKRWKK